MQPYPYAVYPNPNGTTMPVRFMGPANYQQNFPPFAYRAGTPASLRHAQYVPQPSYYPPIYRPAGLRPPMSTMMPIAAPLQQQYAQFYQQNPQFQRPQGYYYNPNGWYGLNPGMLPASRAQTTVPKKAEKGRKDKKTTVPPNEAYKALTSNRDVHALLNHKGTKIKAVKFYKIKKTKPNVDDDSTDDEYEQVPLDSPRAMQASSLAQFQRAPSSTSSCSHCSTCTDCSCTECRAHWQHYRARRYRHI